MNLSSQRSDFTSLPWSFADVKLDLQHSATRRDC